MVVRGGPPAARQCVSADAADAKSHAMPMASRRSHHPKGARAQRSVGGCAVRADRRSGRSRRVLSPGPSRSRATTPVASGAPSTAGHATMRLRVVCAEAARCSARRAASSRVPAHGIGLLSGGQGGRSRMRRASGVAKPASCHTLRHSLAMHLLEAVYAIRTLRELLGHSDVRTTMISMLVLNRGGAARGACGVP